MRLFAMLLAFIVTTPAFAWDATLLADARFSPDGRYFSFIEYVELTDADEEAHASFYLVDTATDSWVEGTPMRIKLTGPRATEANVLNAIRNKGAGMIAKYGMRDAGRPAVSFRDVDRENPYARRRSAAIAVPGKATLDLRERRAKSAHGCTEDYHHASDFRLVMKGSAQPVLLADYVGRLPRSRGCAVSYDIAAAFVHSAGNRTVLATLVGVYTPGWEGTNRTLMAVTKVLP